MQIPPIPSNEQQRLEALNRCQILDTKEEPCFDTLTLLMSETFNAPIALVSLVDSHRQWFKSRQGLNACQTGRDVSFCAHAILTDEPMYVEDATVDPRFFDNALVTGEPYIHTYAGASISSPDGFRLGTVCIIFDKVTPLSRFQINRLKYFAHLASGMVEAHVDRLFNLAQQEQFKHLVTRLSDEVNNSSQNQQNASAVAQANQSFAIALRELVDHVESSSQGPSFSSEPLLSEPEIEVDINQILGNIRLSRIDIGRQLYGKRILLVDDDQSFLLLGHSILQSKGAKVVLADNGASALRQLATNEVDIILTDLVMPKLDGRELVQVARQNGFRGPIIVLSGLSDEVEHQSLLDEGAVAVLTKPLELSRLANVLSQYNIKSNL